MLSHRKRAWVSIAILASALIATACSSPQQTPAPESGDASSTAGTALTPALDHVHGLHLDAEGRVLAGTHTGLFVLNPDGATTRVGDADDDFMGLTGAPGTDNLYASGHPGPSSSAPNPLGLIESVDGGQSWATKSLSGEVDFHALTTDGNTLVGFDTANGIRTSTDSGVSWTDGIEIAARALAITDEGIWATTAGGLQLSTDIGRTFASVPAAPELLLISAAEDGTLWGIDTDGTAWRKNVNDDEWQQGPVVGDVEAIIAADQDTAYAADGRSFHTLTIP